MTYKFDLTSNFLTDAKAYLQPHQTSMIDIFANISANDVRKLFQW